MGGSHENAQKPLVWGSFAAWGRTFSQNSDLFLNMPLVWGNCAARGIFFPESVFFEEITCPGQLRCQGQILFQKSDCFKNITTTISKDALSKSLGARFAEPNVGNFKNCTFRIAGAPVRRATCRDSQKLHFQKFWDSCAQNKTLEISKNECSEPLGLLGAEQNVGNLNNCTSRNSRTPVRRTRRRKSQQLHFQ